MKLITHGIIFLFLTIVWIEPVSALDKKKSLTQYSHDTWMIKEGLPQMHVQTIAQTRDGYLWVGTEEGLTRFDGARFTTFHKKNTPQIKGNSISALLVGFDGCLWIGTSKGLVQYNDGRFKSFEHLSDISDKFIESLYETCDGILWIGTRSGLFRLKNDTLIQFSIRNGLSNDAVYTIKEDAYGAIWIGTGRGLNRLSRKSGSDDRAYIITVVEGLPNDVVRGICIDSSGTFWIGTNAGLCRITSPNGKDRKITTYTTADGLLGNNLWPVYQTKDGCIWVGTNNGLNRIRDKKNVTIRKQDGLLTNIVQCFFEDREGNLWVGTAGGGLQRLRDAMFTAITTLEGLTSDIIWVVCEDRKNNIWVGTQKGLTQFIQEKDGTHTIKQWLPELRISSLAEGREGSFWVGTYNKGLYHFKNGKIINYTTRDGLANDLVRAICEDLDGNLWIGTGGGGLSFFSKGRFTNYSVKEGLSNNVVFSVHQSRTGDLWIGTNKGLSKFKDGKFTNYVEDFYSSSVFTIYEDQEGVFWIGTMDGVVRFKDGKFSVCSMKQGLANDFVSKIIEDNYGYLWLTSNTGVTRIKKEDLNELFSGKIRTIPSIVYTTSDGLISHDFAGAIQPTAWKRKDGIMMFATYYGLAMVDPAQLKINKMPPPVYIEEAVVDKRSLEMVPKSQVSPGSGELEFHYTAINFIASEKVYFKYKLVGFDKEWVEAGTRRVAYYTNIPPGEYQFHVIACNSDGVWNETGASLEFYLTPHFYQTKWFLALCILGLGLIAVGVFRFRIRQLKTREKALTLKVNERTKELQQEVMERKHAEEGLRESMEKFRMVFENAYDGISIFEENPDASQRKLIDCNNRFAEMSGRSREELLRIKTVGSLSELHSHEIDHREIESIGQGVPFHGSFSWLRPDGKENIIDYTGVQIEMQGKIYTIGIDRDVTRQRQTEEERKKLIDELQSTLADVKLLTGLVPICANCKKIRDDKGYWTQVEAYIQKHSQAKFSHSVCPECAEKLYGDLYAKVKKQQDAASAKPPLSDSSKE